MPVTRLWPPNHKLHPITIGGVADAAGKAMRIRIEGIYQDEPTSKHDDDDRDIDAFGLGTPIAVIRAERNGGGDGRIYEIHYTAFGSSTCHGVVIVTVPASAAKPAVDSRIRIDSTSGRFFSELPL